MEGDTLKKTFCDRDGKQCVNTIVIVQVRQLHQTQDGQYVGVDEFNDIELCKDCAELLQEFMPKAFTLRRHDPELADAAVPIREGNPYE